MKHVMWTVFWLLAGLAFTFIVASYLETRVNSLAPPTGTGSEKMFRRP